MVNDNQFDYGIDNNQKVYVIDLGEVKSEPKQIPSDVIEQFKQFKVKYNKRYSSEIENNFRQNIYYNNYKYIQESNGNPKNTFELGETQFMDLSKEEFKEIYLMKTKVQMQMYEDEMIHNNIFQIQGQIDWRGKAVTRIKNQGQCGSCWTFSATGALEGYNAINGHGIMEFSEQQILDCVREDYGCYGCDGGIPYNALKWSSEFGNVLEQQYPYIARQNEKCQQKGGNQISNKAYKIAKSEKMVQARLEKQPLSVCVDASNWYLYKKGVFNNCEQEINHAVTLVGYNSTQWIIKNSWDTTWGEDGYIRLSSGNTCGILNEAVYVE